METISGPYVYPEQGSSDTLILRLSLQFKEAEYEWRQKIVLLAAAGFYLDCFLTEVMGIRKADSGRRYAFLRNSDSWTLDCHENSAAWIRSKGHFKNLSWQGNITKFLKVKCHY